MTLMEDMAVQPEVGDWCRVRYTGYDANGHSPMPVKEGVGEYLGTDFWGGGRYQRNFQFKARKRSIYDDHDVFELTVLRCPKHPDKRAARAADNVVCGTCGDILDRI